MRVSPACYALTGYHPHEYANSSLLDWLHPSDLHLVKMERVRLITVPFVPAPLQSDREIQAAINRRSEGELLSPAEGMGVPFPNQNVRIVRSDGHFSLFNIRLHLGGGLGASLWREETLGRIYLVVSLLLITPRTNTLPPELTAHRSSPLPSPKPISSAQAPVQCLPSFPFLAAVADGPARSQTTSSQSPSNYTSAPPAPTPPPPLTAPAYSNYPRNVPASAIYLSTPPFFSPPAAYCQPAGYPVDNPALAQVGVHPPGSQGNFYPPAPPPLPPFSTDPYGRTFGEWDDWGRIPSN
jgi:hypothetical protein